MLIVLTLKEINGNNHDFIHSFMFKAKSSGFLCPWLVWHHLETKQMYPVSLTV